jgi:ferredoxin
VQITVDGALCTGQGRCAAMAPSVFDLDDEGFNTRRDDVLHVPAGEEDAARIGLLACPERAIAIVDG